MYVRCLTRLATIDPSPLLDSIVTTVARIIAGSA
jgi:hypothetical protein